MEHLKPQNHILESILKLNNRIKELIAEAGIAMIPNSHPISIVGLVTDLEKFAELIIKECCQLNYDFNESYRSACEVNSEIRNHFGVKDESI